MHVRQDTRASIQLMRRLHVIRATYQPRAIDSAPDVPTVSVVGLMVLWWIENGSNSTRKLMSKCNM